MRFFDLLLKIGKAYFGYRKLKSNLTRRGIHGVMLDAYCKGDYQTALQIATSLHDDFFRGTLLLQLGRFPDAEQCFRQVLTTEKEPRLAALANVSLGQVLLQQQRFEQAIECFYLALELWPDRGSTHRDMAEVCLRRGDSPEALRWARLAVEKERAGEGLSAATKKSNLSENLATLAWAVAVNSRDSAEVERLSAEAIALCEGSPVTSTAQVRVHCGMAYAGVGDMVKSAQHFEAAERVDPNGVWGRTAQSMAAGVR